MKTDNFNNVELILLADDDVDDCMFFENAIEELKLPVKLVSVHDGEAVMNWLKIADILPDIIFLDMNMPCKNGAECLAEIRAIEHLKDIPIVIISTSLDDKLVKSLHQNGAQWFIKKPNLFLQLKFLIAHVIELVAKRNVGLTTLEKFVLTVEKK